MSKSNGKLITRSDRSRIARTASKTNDGKIPSRSLASRVDRAFQKREAVDAKSALPAGSTKR